MNLPTALYDSLLTAETAPLINVGTGEDLTIRQIVELVMKVLEFDGELVFDPSRADGTPRKLLDVTRIHSLGWRAVTSVEDGIRKAWASVKDKRTFAAQGFPSAGTLR